MERRETVLERVSDSAEKEMVRESVLHLLTPVLEWKRQNPTYVVFQPFQGRPHAMVGGYLS